MAALKRIEQCGTRADHHCPSELERVPQDSSLAVPLPKSLESFSKRTKRYDSRHLALKAQGVKTGQGWICVQRSPVGHSLAEGRNILGSSIADDHKPCFEAVKVFCPCG